MEALHFIFYKQEKKLWPELQEHRCKWKIQTHLIFSTLSSLLLSTPIYPTQVGHGPVLGVKSRETPCSRGDEMLRQSEWMRVYRSPPCGRIWESFITFPSCWAKIMPPLLSSSATQWISLKGYPVGDVNAFILLVAVLVTHDLQNVPAASTYLFTILCI